MKRNLLLISVLLITLLAAVPALAGDQITVVSQPEEAYIFLNGIAFVRDRITLPGGADVVVRLPAQTLLSTLTLREDGARVESYRVRQADGGMALEWQSAAGDQTREAQLEYLLSGLSWTPRYDMRLGAETSTTVDFSFRAEVQNSAFDLQAVKVYLVAGRVDASVQMDTLSSVTMNQYLAGYDEAGPAAAPPTGDVGAATIQYIYDGGTLTVASGELLNRRMVEASLPARRVILWNAQTDQQASLIYKVKNGSDLPFTEGIVHAYQDGIFIGSDFMEITPVGSEGSITVGRLQNLRVSRDETQKVIEGISFFDYEHQVELTLSNFAEEAVTVEVVDMQRTDAEELTFSQEPAREIGNVLRWVVTVQPAETVTITYGFKTR